MIIRTFSLFLVIRGPGGIPATRAAEGLKPVKVFILAGQSNMEGQAVADLDGKDYNGGKGTLKALLNDPALLIVDEPTAGLDPIGAAAFDELTQSLQQTLGFTVFLITHDLDTLYAICDRVAVLADRKVIGVGTIPELLAMDHPWIQEYFNGPRGRAATAAVDRNTKTEA